MREILRAQTDGTVRKVKAYDLHEVAELTGYHYDTVRRRIAGGLWPYVAQGRRIYLTEDQLWQVADAGAHDYPAHEPGGK